MKNIVDTEGKIQLVIAPRATDSSNEKKALAPRSQSRFQAKISSATSATT